MLREHNPVNVHSIDEGFCPLYIKDKKIYGVNALEGKDDIVSIEFDHIFSSNQRITVIRMMEYLINKDIEELKSE